MRNVVPSGGAVAIPDVVRSASLTQTLEQRLERLISEGMLAPGQRVNENQLACLFGTSRGPLREATRSLEAKGFLRSVRHRGVFVRQLSLQEVLEVYDMRAALFGLAARLACTRRSAALLHRLSGLIDEMDVAAAASDVERFYPLNLAFHEMLTEAGGNHLVIAEMQRLVTKIHLFDRRGMVNPQTLAQSNEEHRAIVDALGSGSLQRAHDASFAHVAAGRSRLLSRLAAEEEAAEDAVTSSGGAGLS